MVNTLLKTNCSITAGSFGMQALLHGMVSSFHVVLIRTQAIDWVTYDINHLLKSGMAPHINILEQTYSKEGTKLIFAAIVLKAVGYGKMLKFNSRDSSLNFYFLYKLES